MTIKTKCCNIDCYGLREIKHKTIEIELSKILYECLFFSFQ